MTKLTLSIDEEVVKIAKDLARDRGSSVSEMVTAFFVSLARASQPPSEVPPVLQKLTGVLKPEEADPQDYLDHLKRKYS